MNYFVGIDVGTSGTKAVLFDEKGNISAEDYREYPLYQPHNGWAEQDAEDWKNASFEAVGKIVKNVPKESVRGIGVSGQMHGLVLLGGDNKPLCKSIIWCDQRTAPQVNEVCDIIGKDRYIELTYNAPNTAFTLMKLLWIKENRPEIFEKTKKVLLPKDYINYCFTGKFTTDVSDAGGTGYFSVKNRTWCREILDAFSIPAELLPEIHESCDSVGRLSGETAQKLGLTAETIVAAGAGDQAAAALGNGIVREGDMSVSMGTSGVVFAAVNEPVYDKKGRIHTFCHAVPGMYHVMGVTQSCGLSLSWFKNTFAAGSSYKELDKKAEKTASDGIVFLPYLMGERTPHLDSECRGSFTGLSAGHTVDNLYRAVLEGVCFSLKDCYELIKTVGAHAHDISVCGGGSKSAVWLKILADILGRDISKSSNSESGARGAAVLAAASIYGDVTEAADAMTRTRGEIIQCDNDSFEYYESLYNVYRNLYYGIENSRRENFSQ